MWEMVVRHTAMEDLGIVQLTPKEIAKIPDRLTAPAKTSIQRVEEEASGN